MPVTFTQQIFANGAQQMVTITVTNDYGYDSQDKKLIAAACIDGVGSLHQSSKVKNYPVNAVGYLHNYSSNTVYAVASITGTAPTFNIDVNAYGDVKNGMHRFKN